jgi:hypothetical protein
MIELRLPLPTCQGPMGPLCSPLPAQLSHQPAGHLLQTLALSPREVHIAAQGSMEVLQGLLCHLHLPLGHEDVLAKSEASHGTGQAQGKGSFLPRLDPCCQQAPAPDSPPAPSPSSRSPPYSSHYPCLLQQPPLPTAPSSFHSLPQIWRSEIPVRELPRGAVTSAGSQSKCRKNPASSCQVWGRGGWAAGPLRPSLTS